MGYLKEFYSNLLNKIETDSELLYNIVIGNTSADLVCFLTLISLVHFILKFQKSGTSFYETQEIAKLNKFLFKF